MNTFIRPDLWIKYLARIRGTHHVPEMGAQSSCGLVVLHYTVIVEDFSTAFTVAEIKKSLWSFRFIHTDFKKKKKKSFMTTI